MSWPIIRNIMAKLQERDSGLELTEDEISVDGKAIDIALPGCKLADLRRAALSLRAGGVGYYPASDFVHLDLGRVRSWSG